MIQRRKLMRLRLNLIILFTIITLIFFNILSVNASSSQMIGDVDKNGKINIIDVRLLLQKVINQNYQEEEAKILDYNRDDDVSIIDVRLLLQDVINGKFDDEIIPKETVQSVIQEVADAYYYRGINAQYSAPRKTEKIAPEEATSQHKIYSTCSTLIFSVYYQSFGIELPINTNNLLAYAKGVYNANDKTNDVVEYWEKGENGYVDNKGNSKEIDLYTEQGIEKYGAELLKTLQIGDIIVFRYIGGGYHAVMVYDYVYNEEGEIIDVVLRESTSHYEKESTKINGGLSYLDILNENNNVQEGTYRELNLINEVKINKDNPTNGIGTRGSYLKKSIAYQTNKEPQCKYFAVIRPLLQNEEGNYTGKYYLASTTQDASEELGYRYDSRKIQEFSISDIALQRANYSKIYIEKTVNYFNNSVIEVGNTLTYTIKIKNNSEQTYDSFEIIENIPEEVEVKSAAGGTINENKITWKVASLNAGEEIEKKYSVIIKSGTPLGSKIISTGTVAGIPSSTITNFVSSNLTTEQKQAIAKTAKTEIDANYKGKELIAKIYEDTFGVDVNLDSFNLEDLVRIKGKLIMRIHDMLSSRVDKLEEKANKIEEKLKKAKTVTLFME